MDNDEEKSKGGPAIRPSEMLDQVGTVNIAVTSE